MRKCTIASRTIVDCRLPAAIFATCAPSGAGGDSRSVGAAAVSAMDLASRFQHMWSSATTGTSSSLAPGRRALSGVELQGRYFQYGAGISIFSAPASAYQLCRLYKAAVPPSEMAKAACRILPHQTLLKLAQMNASAPVKRAHQPWAAFAVVGILQGGVYGQSSVHFAKAFSLVAKAPSLAGMFRGSMFAAGRDSLSQGIPFVLADPFRRTVVDRVVAADSDLAKMAKKWGSLILTSIGATVASQGLHNGQLRMQSEPEPHVRARPPLARQPVWAVLPLARGGGSRGPPARRERRTS